MPELPEVETARRIVEAELAGLEVLSVDVSLPKLLRFSEISSLDPLLGRTITGSRRRGKLLVIDFSDDLSLVVHFKLAGQLSVHHRNELRRTAGHPVPDPDGPYPHKSTHVKLTMTNGSIVYFSDIRQFGWLRLMPTDQVEFMLEGMNLGPDGVGPDRISAEQLRSALKRRSIPVKLAILDQQTVAGIGNIYADEALHRARIHPATPANIVSARKVRELNDAIEWALLEGIEQGGAKIVHQTAYPVNEFPAVHGREGELCPRCGAVIRKIKVGARGTYYCPRCQRKKSAIPI